MYIGMRRGRIHTARRPFWLMTPRLPDRRAAPFFGLDNSSTGQHHFDPVSRGSQLG